MLERKQFEKLTLSACKSRLSPYWRKKREILRDLFFLVSMADHGSSADKRTKWVSSVLNISLLLMIYQVYILFSSKLNRFYVGQTSNLDRRIEEHNNGESPYTSQGVPWQLVWSTSKPSRSNAEVLEKKLKNLNKDRKLKFMFKYVEGIKNMELLSSLN